jgi:hypothetical protein
MSAAVREKTKKKEEASIEVSTEKLSPMDPMVSDSKTMEVKENETRLNWPWQAGADPVVDEVEEEEEEEEEEPEKQVPPGTNVIKLFLSTLKPRVVA